MRFYYSDHDFDNHAQERAKRKERSERGQRKEKSLRKKRDRW